MADDPSGDARPLSGSGAGGEGSGPGATSLPRFVWTSVAVIAAIAVVLVALILSGALGHSSHGPSLPSLATALRLGTGRNVTSTGVAGCVDGRECYSVGVRSVAPALTADDLTFRAQSAVGVTVHVGSWWFTLVSSGGLNTSAAWQGSGGCTGTGCTGAVSVGMAVVFHTDGTANLTGDEIVGVGVNAFTGAVNSSPMPLDTYPLGAFFAWGPAYNVTAGTSPPIGCTAAKECYTLEVASATQVTPAGMSFGARTPSGGAIAVSSWTFSVVSAAGTNVSAVWSGAGTCSGTGCSSPLQSGESIVVHTTGTTSLGGDSIVAIGEGRYTGTVTSTSLPA